MLIKQASRSWCNSSCTGNIIRSSLDPPPEEIENLVDPVKTG